MKGQSAVIQVEVLILSHRIQRDVGHLALLFVGQEGVAEGFCLIKRVFIVSPSR